MKVYCVKERKFTPNVPGSEKVVITKNARKMLKAKCESCGITKTRFLSKSQSQGGALARHKTRLVDKIAEGASMFLSGPSPSFATAAAKLAGQAFKGVSDNVKYFRRT